MFECVDMAIKMKAWFKGLARGCFFGSTDPEVTYRITWERTLALEVDQSIGLRNGSI